MYIRMSGSFLHFFLTYFLSWTILKGFADYQVKIFWSNKFELSAFQAVPEGMKLLWMNFPIAIKVAPMTEKAVSWCPSCSQVSVYLCAGTLTLTNPVCLTEGHIVLWHEISRLPDGNRNKSRSGRGTSEVLLQISSPTQEIISLMAVVVKELVEALILSGGRLSQRYSFQCWSSRSWTHKWW